MSNRRWLFVGALLVTGVLLAACGQAPAQSWPGLAVDEDTAYVAYGQQVYAVRLSDGKQDWAFPEKPSGSQTFYADPTLAEDTMLVGSYNKTVSAVDLNTRAMAWAFAEPEDVIIGSTAVGGGMAFIPSADYSLYAVDADTGSKVWKFTSGQGMWSDPVVLDDRVYVSSLDHHVYALDRESGKEIWSADLGGAIAGTPAYADGRLYVGILDQKFAALDAETGDVVWTFDAKAWVWAEPTLAEAAVYFGDLSGNFYALDAASGQPKWEKALGNPVRGSAAFHDGAVYVGTQDGTLYALAAGDGDETWKVKVSGGQLLTDVVVARDMILVAPHAGPNLLEARRPADGSIVWAFAPGK